MVELAKKLFVIKSDNTHVQFLRYLFVGGVSAIVDMGVFFIAVNMLDLHYLAGQTFGFIFGLITNYIISVLWVFRHTGNLQKEFSLFAIVGIGGLLLSYVFLWIFIDIFQIHTFGNMLAKIITVFLVLFWNFGMRKKFVFLNSTKS